MGTSAATGTAGGGGLSQACAVSGRFLTVIHFGQPPAPAAAPSSASVPGGFLRSLLGPELLLLLLPVRADMSSALLGMPSFFMATLPARPENMMGDVGVCR